MLFYNSFVCDENIFRTWSCWRHQLHGEWKYGGRHGAAMLGRRLGFALCPRRVPGSSGNVSIWFSLGNIYRYQPIYWTISATKRSFCCFRDGFCAFLLSLHASVTVQRLPSCLPRCAGQKMMLGVKIAHLSTLSSWLVHAWAEVRNFHS